MESVKQNRMQIRDSKICPDSIYSFILHRILKINRKQQKLHESTYLNEKNKVLERCIEMCFLLKLDHRVKMLVINMSINSEESFEYCFCH